LPELIPNQFAINSHPFSESLIHWYSGAKRDLPWRKTRDPYIVWVSEIILQQTRVEQGLPYFERFVEAFPSISHLAGAKEDKVLSLWQGLGYYSRARNMQAAAKQVMNDFRGIFPTTYSEILKLKGIGPYTAAAIASICFDESTPVVDGNVFRAAARVFGINEDISKSGTRTVFEKTLQEVIPQDQPGTFNQAMMELGATICTPTPKCDTCPVQPFCFAFAHKQADVLPVKGKKLKVRERHIRYLVIHSGDQVLLKKRESKDIWQGLYDFPELVENAIEQARAKVSRQFIHLLSHQKLHVRFYEVEVSVSELHQYARRLHAKPYSLKQMLTLPKPILVVNYLMETSFADEPLK
jgi:A/G-specific adenine glycosylase